MAKDNRLYGKFTLDFPDNAKIAILSDAAFRALVEMTLWSRSQLSDGLIKRRYALSRWGAEVLAELCENDDDKPSLVETEIGWEIRDYAEHQDTKAEVEARSERNRIAGQRGGQAKAKQGAKRPAKRPAKQVASDALSESVAVVETETETELRASARSSSARQTSSRPSMSMTELATGHPETCPEPPPPERQTGAVATTAGELVTAELPRGRYPDAVLTDLRLRVGTMLAENVDPELIRATLRLWDARDGGTGLLPHLLADAAKTLRPTNPTANTRPTAYQAKTAHNAEVFAALGGAEQTDHNAARTLTAVRS